MFFRVFFRVFFQKRFFLGKKSHPMISQHTMEFILYPDPIKVTRPTNGSSNDSQTMKTVSPTYRDDPTAKLGYTFVYIEPIWRYKVAANAIWDDTMGKYTRRYKNGRIVDWIDDRAIPTLYQKRVDLNIRGVTFSMDWDTIDPFCRECPEVDVTTVDGREYWPLTDIELMALVTRDNCPCAEFTFMRENGIDKRSRHCRHIKQLLSGDETMVCAICCTAEHADEPTPVPALEFFQYCEQKNCDNLICSTCYESVKNKFASCPYCRKSI